MRNTLAHRRHHRWRKATDFRRHAGIAGTGGHPFLNDEKRKFEPDSRYLPQYLRQSKSSFSLSWTRPDRSFTVTIRASVYCNSPAKRQRHPVINSFAANSRTDLAPRPVIGPPEAVASAILAHDEFGVALTTLHIEWMVQNHYVDSVKDNQDLDPQFKSLLKHHWLEEVQHAKLDTLMVEAMAATRTEKEILNGVEEYLAIGGFIDNGLTQQVEFDLASLISATGRQFTDQQQEEFRRIQRQANRWTYLGSGMTHPKVLETLESLSPKARERVETVSVAFC